MRGRGVSGWVHHWLRAALYAAKYCACDGLLDWRTSPGTPTSSSQHVCRFVSARMFSFPRPWGLSPPDKKNVWTPSNYFSNLNILFLNKNINIQSGQDNATSRGQFFFFFVGIKQNNATDPPPHVTCPSLSRVPRRMHHVTSREHVNGHRASLVTQRPWWACVTHPG